MTRCLRSESKVQVLVAQSCPTLCDRMDCSPPGSSVHGILQGRILEWVAISLPLQGIFPTQGLNLSLLHCRLILYHMSHQGSAVVFLTFYISFSHDLLPSLCQAW